MNINDMDVVIFIDMDMIGNQICINTNIAETGKIHNMLNEFLRSCSFGRGADNSEANVHDLYTISIGLTLQDDTWYTQHNCGNLGLRDGIVIEAIRRLVKND